MKKIHFLLLLFLLISGLTSGIYLYLSSGTSSGILSSSGKNKTSVSSKIKSENSSLGPISKSETELKLIVKMTEDAVYLLYHGKKEEGIKALLQVLKRDPENQMALEELGLYYLEEGQDLKKAQDYFERLYKVNPQSPVAITELVSILEELGGVRKAEDFLKEVYKNNPSDPMVSSALAQILAKDGRIEEATSFTESALKNAKNSFELEDLAFAYYENKDFIKAGSLFERVLELKEQEIKDSINYETSFEMIRTKLSYAKVKFELGDCEESLKILKEIASKLKDDPSFLSFQLKVLNHCQ